MKLRILPLLLAASALCFADGNSASANVSAGATLISPISISKQADLNFGTIVVNPSSFTPGGMNVDPNGVLTTSFGGGTWLYTGTGQPPPSAAQFSVTGQDGYAFGFIVNPFVVALKDGSSFSIIPNIAIVDGLTHGTIPSPVKVGGQLGLLNAKPGLWSGTFTAIVAYI
jgi:hypothetical protein